MRYALIFLVGMLTVALPALPSAQSDTPAIVGTWSGTFEGDSSGTVSSTVTQGEAKALAGTLTVKRSDGGTFTVDFKSVVASGATATMKYDSSDGSEVQIDVTVEGTSVKGTWKAVDPATSNPVAQGTVTGTKK